MTEDLNVFPNADSTLFGAGEDSVGIITTPATAGLSGSASVESSNTGSAFINGTGTNFSTVNNRFGNFVGGTTLGSSSPSVPSTDSLVVIMLASEQGNGTGVVKVRNTTTSTDIGTLNMTSGGAGTLTLSSILVVDGSPSLGVNNTYSVISVGTGSFFRIHMRIQITTLNDSHAGFIETVAVAGKQINAADSHTTREISVLPA